MGKKKKLKGDQYFTTGYIDYVPGSSTFDSDKDNIKEAVDRVNEKIKKVTTKNEEERLNMAYRMLREELGFPDAVDAFMRFKETPKKNDPVNHPSHYTRGKIEVIDFIETWGLDNLMHIGTAVKYICRAGYKDPDMYATDLSKAVWYLNRALQKIENGFILSYGEHMPGDPHIELPTFLKDQGLYANWNLSVAMFYICYAVNDDTIMFLEMAISYLEDEINKSKEN